MVQPKLKANTGDNLLNTFRDEGYLHTREGYPLRARNLKKCKHFLMIINFVREQVSMGVIEIRKILGTDNIADIHTKRVRSKDFQSKAIKMLGEDSTAKPPLCSTS
mmetsp:Transcript_18181/g.24971  ORF Transcript_18181/g.24971 Transcript_18181/m.24971 type:complete len:106 (-) Transcript_18181:689-1006(-)